MKKLLSLLLILSIIQIPFVSLSAGTTSAKTRTTLLSQLNLVPDGVSVIDEGAVTRRTVAYTVSVIANVSTYDIASSQINDIDEADKAFICPIVSAGIMEADGIRFNPDKKVTFSDARAALVKAIAPSIRLTASQLNEMIDGVRIINTSALSNFEFFKIVENALNIKLPKVTYKESDSTGELVASIDNTIKESTLASRFEVNVYDGTLTEANTGLNSARLYVTKNVNLDNPQSISVGSECTFSSLPNVNIYHFENAPVRVWVADELIICIELQKDITITYNCVYSINGDTNEGNTYAPAYFDNMYLYDVKKRYTFDAGFVMKYNDEYTAQPVDIIGNFAKVILKDSKVILMEAWDISEGGIVEAVSDEEITYTHYNTCHNKLRELDRYDKILVFMENRSTELAELKANTYFEYYANEDNGLLVIVANEKVVTGTFDSAGDESIIVSGHEYAVRGDLYYSISNGAYSADTDPTRLMNQLVDIYFTYEGYGAYIRISQGKTIDDGSFLAAVMTYVDKSKRDDDGDVDRDKITLFLLDDTLDRRSFDVAKKCTFEDGLTIDDLLYNAMDKYGDGIYRFRLNALGEVCKISKPIELTGVPSHQMGQNLRPSADATMYMLASVVGVKQDGSTTNYNSVVYLDDDTRFIGLSSDGTYFKATEVQWGNLYEHRALNGGIKIHYFAPEENNAHHLTVVMAGDMKQFGSNNCQQGLITSINKVINKYDEEICYQVRLLSNEGDTKHYIRLEDGADLKQYTYIEYNSNLIGNNGYIDILSTNDFSGPMSTWKPTFVRYNGPFVGVSERVDGQMLFFKAGNAGTIHKKESFILVDHGVGEHDRFELIDKDQIQTGWNCIYNVGDSMKMLIVEEN